MKHIQANTHTTVSQKSHFCDNPLPPAFQTSQIVLCSKPSGASGKGKPAITTHTQELTCEHCTTCSTCSPFFIAAINRFTNNCLCPVKPLYCCVARYTATLCTYVPRFIQSTSYDVILQKAAMHRPVLNRHRTDTALAGVLLRTQGSAVSGVKLRKMQAAIPEATQSAHSERAL